MKIYKTLKPVRPSAVIEQKYKSALIKLIKEMHNSVCYWLKAAYRKGEKAITQDSPTDDINKRAKQLIRQWKRRYGDMSRKLAEQFAKETRSYVAGNLQRQFKELSKQGANFDLAFQYMSRRERFVFNAIVESNVNLIQSIGNQYLSDVQGIVLRSIESGNDLSEMTQELFGRYDITERRAAMIARDQSAKANENLQRTRLQDYGVKQGRWLHTSSGKTYRESHVEMDGQVYNLADGCFDVDEGRNVHPAELVNCRCVCVPIIPDVTDVEEIEKQETEQEKPKEEEEKEPTFESDEAKELQKGLKADNVEYNPVKILSQNLSEDDIIKKIGGGDKTGGSCASLSFTYAGNKLGLDVLDFRGGLSQNFFSTNRNLNMIANLPKVNAWVQKNFNDFTTASNLLKEAKQGKEYIFGCAKHMAVVKKVGEQFEYLELQTTNNNGWHSLTKDALKNRFGCKKSHTVAGFKFEETGQLIEIDSLKDNKDFKKLLGYLNTAKDKQNKGVGGGAK